MLVALVFNFIVFPLFFFQSDHFNNWMLAGAALTKKAMPNTKEFTPALRASFQTVEMIFIIMSNIPRFLDGLDHVDCVRGLLPAQVRPVFLVQLLNSDL